MGKYRGFFIGDTAHPIRWRNPQKKKMSGIKNLFVRKVCNKYSVAISLLLQYAPTELPGCEEETSLRPKITFPAAV